MGSKKAAARAPRKSALTRTDVPVSGAGLAAKLERSAAGLKKEFERARAEITRLRGRGSEAFDALYELVGRVIASDPPLYLGGGHRSVRDFIAMELPGETVRSVQRNVLVARCFSPADEARHGITFLEEVAKYAQERMGTEEPPPAINLDRLVITLPSSSGAVGKPARQATIDEVRKARRSLQKGAASSKAGAAEKALRAALGDDERLAQVAVRAGATTASFGGVPLSAVGAFGRALASVKIDATGVRNAASKPRASSTAGTKKRGR
jgi:hypothetical protein